MRTSTEFISEISATTMSTSFDFHLLDFLVKWGRCLSYVYVHVCALLSRAFVTPRHRCVMMHGWSWCTQGQIYSPQFDTTFRNKGYNVRLGTGNLQNVPQHYYLLDTLVLTFPLVMLIFFLLLIFLTKTLKVLRNQIPTRAAKQRSILPQVMCNKTTCQRMKMSS